MRQALLESMVASLAGTLIRCRSLRMNRLSPLLQRTSKAAAPPIAPLPPSLLHRRRSFRSTAALDALRSHIAGAPPGVAHLALYNYPSFSGAFAALFARIYHSRLGLPFLALPFSSVEPLRVDDFSSGGLETCYLLDFIGPKGFAVDLSRFIPRVIAFDHQESTMARIPLLGQLPGNLELHVNSNKCSARAVYDYFSEKLNGMISSLDFVGLLSREEEDRVAAVLRYIEDADLRRWELPNVEAFKIGIREERAKLNCVSNPYVFEQLIEINASELIAKGEYFLNSRLDAANELLGQAFKIRLGRGLYGECLAIRADGNSNLSHEIGMQLSKKSASAGLRPIGAVIFMQRGNLKMCLRSMDRSIDTSEIAKAYGGGGNSGSSSFIIRMDEYSHWTSVNSA